MKRTFLALALGAMIASGGAAMALTSDQVVADLQTAGYSRVAVRVGPTQMKVEAIRGTEKLEVIYDRTSGAVLKTETKTASGRDASRSGVSVRDRNRDFVSTVGGSDDRGTEGKGHDRNHDIKDKRDTSSDGSSDDSSNSHRSDDDGNDSHDSNDSHGSNDNDHSGNDDHNDSHDHDSGSDDNDSSDHDGSDD